MENRSKARGMCACVCFSSQQACVYVHEMDRKRARARVCMGGEGGCLEAQRSELGLDFGPLALPGEGVLLLSARSAG